MPPLNAPTAAFDAEAWRARLGRQQGRALWRSLEELSDDAGFTHWLRARNPQLAAALQVDRRGFLKLLGASLALAGLSACNHPPQDRIVPYVHAPPGQVDGLPRYFATVLERRGHAQGVLVASQMGRPTKIEGNPQHPASLGATDIFAQASILQLWDPHRSKVPLRGAQVAAWQDFETDLAALRIRLQADGGAGLRIVSRASSSPTLRAQREALLKAFPAARWHVHEPLCETNARDGARLAFGKPLTQRLHLQRASRIVCLDADFLADAAAGVRHAHDFAAGRDVDAAGGAMSRLYVVEPTPTLTGASADHRLAMASSRIETFGRALAARLGLAISAAAQLDAIELRWLEALANDLGAHRGASLLLIGPTQPPWLHALGHAINARLGNAGHTFDYCEPACDAPDADDFAALCEQMRAGSVDTLLVLDANPAYDAPADAGFVAALAKVPHLYHLGMYRDETGRLAEWHLPMSHALEGWSDARAFDGTASIAQPLIAPLYDTRGIHEVLALLSADEVRDARTLVRSHWRTALPDDARWDAALQAGVVPDSAFAALAPALRTDWLATPEPAGAAPGELELLLRADATIDDGRWSNNGWLQELPKPFTQLTWDNAALISPALAVRMDLRNGDVVELSLDGRHLRAPVWITPGQAPDSITAPLGYGRRHAGPLGDGQGFDAYALRSVHAMWAARGVRIAKTGNRQTLAGTQQHFNIDGRDLVRSMDLDAFIAAAARSDAPHAAPPPSLYPDMPAGDYAWGMSIDLNACIGCKACTIACQAENNIPVVGKEQVARGREMHWIRVDQYFEGDASQPRMHSQPVPCMMCEHAPCELVCPVGATVHDAEGLNVQVYNRCVGTRFCSNNCPYKVRRFNFLQYADVDTPALAAQRNPQVSVRRRGVMEKCTYCIQRIETAHIQADRDGRRIADGEIVTACQAACPAQAIRFGDVGDAHSAVSRAKASRRNYAMLAELGTRPRTTYLARVRNPNPALPDGLA